MVGVVSASQPTEKQLRLGTRTLITIDWLAGATAGGLMLSLRGWLAELSRLPSELILVMGIANLAYAGVSFLMAMLSEGERVPFILVIAGANILWGTVCVVLALIWWGHASLFGVAQLVGEAVFVAGLGVLEWQAAMRSHKGGRSLSGCLK
jgi:hypothetical protein